MTQLLFNESALTPPLNPSPHTKHPQHHHSTPPHTQQHKPPRTHIISSSPRIFKGMAHLKKAVKTVFSQFLPDFSEIAAPVASWSSFPQTVKYHLPRYLPIWSDFLRKPVHEGLNITKKQSSSGNTKVEESVPVEYGVPFSPLNESNSELRLHSGSNDVRSYEKVTEDVFSARTREKVLEDGNFKGANSDVTLNKSSTMKSASQDSAQSDFIAEKMGLLVDNNRKTRSYSREQGRASIAPPSSKGVREKSNEGDREFSGFTTEGDLFSSQHTEDIRQKEAFSGITENSAPSVDSPIAFSPLNSRTCTLMTHNTPSSQSSQLENVFFPSSEIESSDCRLNSDQHDSHHSRLNLMSLAEQFGLVEEAYVLKETPSGRESCVERATLPKKNQNQLHPLVEDFASYTRAVRWPKHVPLPPPPPPPSPEDLSVDTMRMTYVGHSTFLIQIRDQSVEGGGYNLLTDPHFSKRAGPGLGMFRTRRISQPGICKEELPAIDAVLVTRDSHTHLDLPSLKYVVDRDKSTVFSGLGMSRKLKRFCPSIYPMSWWDEVKFDKLRVRFLPSVARPEEGFWGFSSGASSLWGSFLISCQQGNLFFSGTSGYGAHFRMIKETLENEGIFEAGRGIDVAFLPIGGYAPDWVRGAANMSPEEAVQAHIDLNTEKSIALGFDTFAVGGEAFGEAPFRLKSCMLQRAISDDDFMVLKPGEGFEINASEQHKFVSA